MNNDEFWNHRLTSAKTKLLLDIIAYCDIYDLLHDEVFNGNNVKIELTELIDEAVVMYINDNYK